MSSSERSAPPRWGCALHAAIGRTCCQDTEVMVTDGDKVRVASWLASEMRAGEPFWENDWPKGTAAVDDGSDPTWTRAFHMDGSRPILRHADGGNCMFLGPTGCIMPTDTRPLVCRLYPRNYDEHGFLGLDAMCPSEVVPEGKTILDLLDTDPDREERWRRQLYTEILEAPRR